MDGYNVFKTDISSEYFLKLAPDLSVLDIVEKYMLEHNLDISGKKEKDLFYYNSDDNKNTSCTFRRGLFKILNNVEITNCNSACYEFTVNKDRYLIAINNLEPITFTLKSVSTIIGVAF